MKFLCFSCGGQRPPKKKKHTEIWNFVVVGAFEHFFLEIGIIFRYWIRWIVFPYYQLSFFFNFILREEKKNFVVILTISIEFRLYLHHSVDEESHNSDCIQWHYKSHATALLICLMNRTSSHWWPHAGNRSWLYSVGQ